MKQRRRVTLGESFKECVESDPAGGPGVLVTWIPMTVIAVWYWIAGVPETESSDDD
jgi:hypothetical protein